MPPSRLGWRFAAIWPVLWIVALTFPWLNPFASGPSSSVNPWLSSALCVAAACAIQNPGRLNWAVLPALTGVSAWAFLITGIAPETLAFAAACLLIFVAAGMAAGASSQSKFVQAIALAWLLAAAASTALALLQYFGAADVLAPWVNGSVAGEAYANLRQRNQFASLTVIGMAATLWLSRERRQARWRVVAAMAWLAVGNAATTSRTGLLQMLLLVALAWVWTGPRRTRMSLWLAALLAYAAAALILPWLLEVVADVAGHRIWERASAVDPCSSRTVLWSNVLHLIAQRPWLGWGWGNLDYAHYVTLYDGPRFCDILDNAHNLPLHLAVELGVPAALLICGGVLWAVARARPWAEADPARQMGWAVLAVIAVHSLLEYPLWYGPFQIAFGLCLGLLWPAESRPALPTITVRTRTALIAAVAVACAYAGWDYRRVSQIYLPPEARATGYENPLPEIRKSWLFGNQASFAELTMAPLTRANAQWTFDTAVAMLRYSPEPRVIEKLIDSAILLGRDEEALLHLARYRAAFPDACAKWSETRSHPAGAEPAAKVQPAT